ncbi:MAG: LTA synthase family protein [Eubacteriales bacterium]
MNYAQKPTHTRPRPATFPLWAFFVLTYVYFEILLYILIGISYSGLTWLYLTLTGSAAGILVGSVLALIHKPMPRKITGCVLLSVGAVLFCTEYFIFRSFQTCMSLGSILSGAGGVATGFTSIAVGLILKGFWVILLYFLPLFLFCFFFKRITNDLPRRKSDRTPLVRIGAALFLQLFCIIIIQFSAVDRVKMFKQYDFDSAVHTFGLTNALGLDFLNSIGRGGDSGFTDIDPVTKDTDVPDSTEPSTDTEGTEIQVPIVYGKNEMDIDFASLAETEKKSEIAKLHSYVASLTPSSKNEYTGIFEGKNLILITAEAFSAEVIDKDRTPTLYRLANKGIRFTEYYQPAWGGSTSTGEYSVLMGLVPMNGVKSIKDTIGHNLYLTMGNQLMRKGYYSLAFHNGSYTYYSRNLTHENFGYSKFIGMGNGMEEGVTSCWPESDLEMMQYTLDMYADKQPFSIYYMTVSGHCLYNWAGNSMSKRNRESLESMDASETIKAYHAANLELEKALAYLVSELEARGIADDTVIALSTDHYPYGLENSETWGNDKDYLAELYGYEASDIFKRDHSALIIWSGCLEDRDEPIVVDTPTYSLDILPTLSNLFGLEYDSRLLVGRDVFSDAEPLVIWTNYSWVTDKGFYNASTGTFTPRSGVEVDDAYVKRIKAIVGNKITFSKGVVAQDYYNVLFG